MHTSSLMYFLCRLRLSVGRVEEQKRVGDAPVVQEACRSVAGGLESHYSPLFEQRRPTSPALLRTKNRSPRKCSPSVTFVFRCQCMVRVGRKKKKETPVVYSCGVCFLRFAHTHTESLACEETNQNSSVSRCEVVALAGRRRAVQTGEVMWVWWCGG